MRATVVVIDSFGIGELPDAEQYGDKGSNTALHICEGVSGPKWTALKELGLGNASELLENKLPGCESVDVPSGFFGVMKEKSPGKDTTTGHWELAGLELEKAFHTFQPEYPSFPEDLVKTFNAKTGRGLIGNKAASGIAIIEELGEEHQKTGDLICYTSADSVFQIAAHEETVPLDELYKYCKIARELCNPRMVGRVIARPFTGTPGNYTRSAARKDFSIPLPEPSLLDHLQSRGVVTTAVGKIGDIFNESGITNSYHDKGNPNCLDRTLAVLTDTKNDKEFIFVNLVDTDMMYGHRRDIKGYCQSVEETSVFIPKMIEALDDGDLLIVTADHGCDPSFRGTDHTREHVPLLVYRKGSEGAEVKSLGIRESFSDLAATMAEFFEVDPYPRGSSFVKKL
ncbi:MAG: phosphopentomutase [Spirochaetales bacterium]|nr:phosphopentomutase [Spirochaetales bacterium]